MSYREQLGRQGAEMLVVTRGMDRALWAFAPAAFEVLEQKLSAHSQLDPNVRRAVDFLIGNAADCTFDKMGRVLVPQVLREWAGIAPESEVVWMGANDRIRLFSKAQWQKVLGADDELNPESTGFLASAGI